jgi:hypothetical protein
MHPHNYVFSNSLHEFKINAGGGLVIVYQLDLYERWILHICLALSWNEIVELFREVVGTASEYWLDTFFQEDDSEYFE